MIPGMSSAYITVEFQSVHHPGVTVTSLTKFSFRQIPGTSAKFCQVDFVRWILSDLDKHMISLVVCRLQDSNLCSGCHLWTIHINIRLFEVPLPRRTSH